MLAFLIKLVPLFEWGAKLIKYWQRQGELARARSDGERQAKLDEIIRNQNIEKRHDHAQGAIEEAGKPLDDDAVIKRLRQK